MTCLQYMLTIPRVWHGVTHYSYINGTVCYYNVINVSNSYLTLFSLTVCLFWNYIITKLNPKKFKR